MTTARPIAGKLIATDAEQTAYRQRRRDMRTSLDSGQVKDMAQPTSPDGNRTMIRAILAVSIVGGPLGYLIGGALSPAINGTSHDSIVASAASHAPNTVHMLAFVLASYLLPIGVLGLAYLAYPATPRLAAIGGIIGMVGWLPFSALTALDDATNAMAHMPDPTSYGPLRDRFMASPVMLGYLLVYIVAHLVAYVLLGIALRRGRIIPRWAAWSMIVSSPLTVLAFALPASPRLIGAIALSLLVLGSIPAARRIARD
jgi:hypothetical protein